MITIDRVTVTVSVEGDAEAGERAFARLFDKYSRLRDEARESRTQLSSDIARDRVLAPSGRSR